MFNLPWIIEENRSDHGLMLTAHDAAGNVVRRDTVPPGSPQEAAFRQGVAEVNAGKAKEPEPEKPLPSLVAPEPVEAEVVQVKRRATNEKR